MAALLPFTAAAIDLQPGDVRTPPVGLKLVTTSLVSRTYDGVYRRGEKLPLDGEVRADYFVVRAGASFSFADKPAFLYAQQSYADFTVQGDFVRLGGGGAPEVVMGQIAEGGGITPADEAFGGGCLGGEDRGGGSGGGVGGLDAEGHEAAGGAGGQAAGEDAVAGEGIAVQTVIQHDGVGEGGGGIEA